MQHKNIFLKVTKSQNLQGEVRMPPSKTHSFRALILASLADGISFIRYPKPSGDWHEAVKAMRMYGAKIEEIEEHVFRVEGVGGQLQTPMAPLVIKGKVNGGIAHMDGVGCQPVFSVLLASACSEKPVEVFARNPGEKAYIDLLLYWFRKVGLHYENVNQAHAHYIFPGNKPPHAFDAEIPFEWSVPAYPLLAAILTPDSKICVRGMNWEDPYGDKQVISVLQNMGAEITVDGDTLTARTSKLHGIEVDMNNLPDQVPTIAVAACFAKGKTIIKNALTARWKECDRIAAVCTELSKMGAKVIEKEDGLIIDQDGTWKLHAAQIDGYYDHRMILVFAIAGMQVEGETLISDAYMVEKSFENFIPDMLKVGANFELVEKRL